MVVGNAGGADKKYIHIDIGMDAFHWPAHGSEGAAHQSLRTFELYLPDNPVRLKV